MNEKQRQYFGLDGPEIQCLEKKTNFSAFSQIDTCIQHATTELSAPGAKKINNNYEKMQFLEVGFLKTFLPQARSEHNS